MQSTARRYRSASERLPGSPRHPTGRARRRWPRAYDGGTVAELPSNPRYRQAFVRDDVDRRRTSRRRTAMDSLRQSPIRNGLIGLAVAGTAAPMALNSYQQAMRTDPDHEMILARATRVTSPVSDRSVTKAWNAMESQQSVKESTREGVVQQKMEEYSEFGLTAEMAGEIFDMAEKAGVDHDVAYGLVAAESSFKNVATSRVGAIGLTQLMPSTARWLEPGITKNDLRDSQTNLRIGFGYLKDLIKKYDGNEDLALLAYNRGPGTVDKILKRGGNPDNGYAKFVRTGKVGSHKG